MNIMENKQLAKVHFINLIQVALADGKIADAEKEYLDEVGYKYGFFENEINELIELTKKNNSIFQSSLSQRFELFYEIIKMVLIDRKIHNNEMRLATNYALKYGFKENEIPQLLSLLLKGVRNGNSSEELFDEYISNNKTLVYK